MASTQLELGLLWSHSQQMDVSGSVFVEWHGLQENVVTVSLRCDFISLIDDFVDGLTNFESVWIHLLANFAFESLPVERPNVLILSTGWFFLLLSENPTLEAIEVDQTHSTLAFACNDKWIGRVILVSPADSALDVVHFTIDDVFGSFDLHGLSQFLVVQLFLRHLHVVAPEIFDSESDSSELDGVELLDLVVILPRLVLERPRNQPKSIY